MNGILALSLLLALGFGAAQLARLVRLPSVTGYLVAGLVLGPSGLNLLPRDLLEERLRTFTDIALMLVAFAIGERLDLGQLARGARALVRVSLAESFGAFAVVAIAVFAAAYATRPFGVLTDWHTCLALALVCGSIAVATAPAATIAVIRELGAAGLVSRMLLSCVAVNNALSVALFGLCVVIAQLLLGTAPGALWLQAAMPFAMIAGSLALGLLVGLAADWILHRLTDRSEVLIAALSAVFLTGGLAELLGFSAMLAGLAAGFAIVNRDRRDVRAFRALNDFEPPIYGIFFALAGAQLHLRELIAAGLVGAAFVLGRALGKAAGAYLALRSLRRTELPPALGLGLLTQAGLAIGLAYLVRQNDALATIRTAIINVVVASVVINELVGPALVRWILAAAGEGATPEERARPPIHIDARVVPWTWPKLKPPERPVGTVVFGVSHPDTARGLARIAVLLANYYRARPLGVRVLVGMEPEDFWGGQLDVETRHLLEAARRESEEMGYPALTTVEFAPSVAEGLVQVAEAEGAQAVVLGHPLRGTSAEFRRVVDAVAREVTCPVIVAKFSGPLHTERILVPFARIEELLTVRPVICALAAVAQHELTLLMLLPPETGTAERIAAEREIREVAMCVNVAGAVEYMAQPAESFVHAVMEAAASHDIVVMPSATRSGIARLFFGSLAEDVAARCSKPMLMVRPGVRRPAAVWHPPA